MKCDIGVFACNEQDNISNALDAILTQKLDSKNKIRKIFVIVSGSTDSTTKIVKKYASKHKQILPIIQKKRKGKVSAVNLFLKKSSAKFAVLSNADNVIKKDALNYLLTTLKDKKIGLVASRVIPHNNPDTFFGFAAHLQWNMHHKINLQFPDRPKAGELIAFRRVFKKLHHRVPFDEANLEAIIRSQGYKAKYQPDAIVYNYSPDNFRDFFYQRRRNYAGHIKVKKYQGYQVVTMSNLRLLGTYLSNLEWRSDYLIKSLLVILIEIFARIAGTIDVSVFNQTPKKWHHIKSTKVNLNSVRQKP
jgi:biofilm PGA synthesis N-glycosyltransferase PgaC